MTLVKKNTNIDKVMNIAAERMAGEVQTMSTKSDAAMGIFNSTVKNLEALNAELKVSADRARMFAKAANEKADEAERKIAENNSVCQKIYEIIGKPQAA